LFANMIQKPGRETTEKVDILKFRKEPVVISLIIKSIITTILNAGNNKLLSL